MPIDRITQLDAFSLGSVMSSTVKEKLMAVDVDAWRQENSFDEVRIDISDTIEWNRLHYDTCQVFF